MLVRLAHREDADQTVCLRLSWQEASVCKFRTFTLLVSVGSLSHRSLNICKCCMLHFF